MNLLRLFGRITQSKRSKEDEERRNIAADSFFVYNGKIKKTFTLVETLLKGITNNPAFDLSKKPFVPVNITERIVGDLAMIYKRNAVRKLMVPDTTPDLDPTTGEKIARKPEDPPKMAEEKVFAQIMDESTIAKDSKSWDAYANLFNTVLVRPVWREDDTRKLGGRLEFLIYTADSTSVETQPGNYLKPSEVTYWVEPHDEDSTDDEAFVWTAEKHYKVTGNGEEAVGDNVEKANPYGVLPFAVLRLKDTGEFWGDGAQDLVKGHLTILAMMTLINETSILQGFEEVFFVNLTPQKAGLDAQKKTSVYKTGPGMRHNLDGVDKNDLTPQVVKYTPELQLDEMTRTIDFQCRFIAWRYGLSADRVSAIVASQRIDSSGVAKAMDNADIEEIRVDRLDTYRDFERDLHYLIRTVLKVDADIVLPDGDFAIDFSEMEVKQTPEAIVKKREFDLSHNLTSEVQLMREDNPDMTEAQAVAQWRKNMAFKMEGETLGTTVSQPLQEGDGPSGPAERRAEAGKA